MSNTRFYFLATLILLALCSTSVYTQGLQDDTMKSIKFDYISHSPINVTQDEDFVTLGFLGNGTESDPYIIENYLINTTEDVGLAVVNTTKYFTITSCFIVANQYGIFISTIANSTAKIINNICTNNSIGIYVNESNEIFLLNNTCNSNSDVGIYCIYNHDAVLVNNTCNDNYDGIYLHRSNSSIVTNCNASSNVRGTVIHITYYTTVNYSYFINNSLYGIGAYASEKGVCSHNLLKNNSWYGIMLNFNSKENSIHHNIFIDNNREGGYAQGCDYGEMNLWYDPTTQEGNYYSDWTSSDPYVLDGEPDKEDPYPLNSPVIKEFSNRQSFVFGIMLALLIPIILTSGHRSHSKHP